MIPIEYDKYGRMKYNPEFHPNAGNPWSSKDLEYLIEWFDKIGAEEMSLALGRPMTTVSNKVSILRKKGVMKKNNKRSWHVRIRNR